MRPISYLLTTLAGALLLITGTAQVAMAQDIEPYDATTGYDHVNPPPDGFNSTADWCFSLRDPSLIGKKIEVRASGPSGPVMGTGEVQPDGTVLIPVGIREGGNYTVTSVTVVGSGRTVDASQVATVEVVFSPLHVDCLQTLMAAPPPTSTAPPAAPPTEVAPTSTSPPQPTSEPQPTATPVIVEDDTKVAVATGGDTSWYWWLLIIVGLFMMSAGGWMFLGMFRDSATAWTLAHLDAFLGWDGQGGGPLVSLADDDPSTLPQVDAEESDDRVTSANQEGCPFPRATGRGSWFRNNRCQQVYEESGEWVDPSTIQLPGLLQNVFDNTPEPPKVITPEMASARQGMLAGADAAGLQLAGKALLTDSYGGPTGAPHMFWTVRVAADGSILHTWDNAEPGGPVAAYIGRIKVYQVDPGVWWAHVKLVDTTKARIVVTGGPASGSGPDDPLPQPSTPEEAIHLTLTNLVSGGMFNVP
jgi:hypothetical protein